MYCSIAGDNSGQRLGFSIHVTHPESWGIGDVCYSEDLYVIPEYRCKGTARKMISNLVERGKKIIGIAYIGMRMTPIIMLEPYMTKLARSATGSNMISPYKDYITFFNLCAKFSNLIFYTPFM